MLRFCTMLLAVFLVFGCEPSNQSLIESAPLISRKYTDDLGREIVLKKRPKKVISLAPNITEMIFAIGAENSLIARSQACDYPIEALDYPQVTTYPELDLAGIVSLDPDLILTTNEIFGEQSAEFFDRYNIPLYFQSYNSLDDIYRNVEVLGDILDHKPQAKKLVDSLQGIATRIVDSTKGQAKFRTAVLVGIRPIIVAGGGGFINEMIVKAGGKNAFGNLSEKYPTVSEEAFLKAAPEILVLPTSSEQAYQDFAAEHPLVHLNSPAAQNNRVYILDPDIFFRPGPRTVEGLAYLARTLHSRIDPADFFE
jgi:iron complex transport system substrate-binding protein